MSIHGKIARAGTTKIKRALGVPAALGWAFRVEQAQLELPPREDGAEEGFGFGLEHVLLQRAMLGCKVDGGQHKENSPLSGFAFSRDHIRHAGLHSSAAGRVVLAVAAGVWAHVHDGDLEGREESPSAAIIDSQSVKTAADAREMVGFDAGKRIKGRKRHLVTDMLDLMLRVEVHSAGLQDRDGAALVLERITRRFPFIEKFFADAGYQGPRVAEAAPRPVEIIKRTDPGFVLPKRWVIERTFAWACMNRRLAKDFERFAATAKALFQIAMIKLMIRRIARYRDF